MIILLAGVSRSGKSILARRLSKEFGYNYFPLDPVISTLEVLYPEIGIQHFDDNLAFSPRLAVLLKELTDHLAYEGQDFVLDTYQLFPKDYLKVFPGKSIPIIYLGYPGLTPQEKLVQIRTHQRKQDWTVDTEDQEMHFILGDFIRESRIMAQQCKDLGLSFFDTGLDFQAGVDQAYAYLEDLIRVHRDQ